jgi:predicted DNA binding protein
VFDGLTERQQAVLRTAFFAGFFEWPRESTCEDVADLLGVSQPTVNRHLRHALSRLLQQLFEEEPTAIAPT